MKYLLKITLSYILVSIHFTTFSQLNHAEGYFTSEAEAIMTDSGIIVSLKKFNPTKTDIDNAMKPPKNGPWNYLMLPYETKKVLMNNKGFESKLYSLNKESEVVWERTLGYSDKSQASQITLHDNFIFAGESHKSENKVIIQKIDLSGKTVWEQVLDSLNNVDDIIVSGGKVCVLVSFDHYKKVKGPDNTYTNKMFPVYFYVQMNIETGEIIKKEYQKMGVYLSGMGFANPVLNSENSYFLNTQDSAAFLSTIQLEKATIVSDNLAKASKISLLSAGLDSYHLLYEKPKARNKTTYNLFSGYYGEQKKYDVELPIEPMASDRTFIAPASDDSLFVIIGKPDKLTILLTDHAAGNTIIYKQTIEVLSPLLFAGYAKDKIFVLQGKNRAKPGTPGELIVTYY